MKTVLMSRADHQKWDYALRNGNYNKTKGKLCDATTGAMCCLGILELAVGGEVYDTGLGYPSYGWLKKHGITFRNEYGREHHSPYLGTGYAEDFNDGCTITGVRDIKEHTFAEIADIIQQNIEYTD